MATENTKTSPADQRDHCPVCGSLLVVNLQTSRRFACGRLDAYAAGKVGSIARECPYANAGNGEYVVVLRQKDGDFTPVTPGHMSHADAMKIVKKTAGTMYASKVQIWTHDAWTFYQDKQAEEMFCPECGEELEFCSCNDTTPQQKIEDDEAMMQRIEAEGDRAQTVRDETAKDEFKQAVETQEPRSMDSFSIRITAKGTMKPAEIKETIRQMLKDWDSLTEQQREDALQAASGEFTDRRRHYHTEPIK